MYVPEQVVTNQDLLKYMETSDAWIQERTGIQERRYAHRTRETTTTMAVEASRIAIERIGARLTDRVATFTLSTGPVPHLVYAIDRAGFASGPLAGLWAQRLS